MRRLYDRYHIEIKRAQASLVTINLKPNRQNQLDFLVKQLLEDHCNLSHVANYCEDRVFKGIQKNSNEKLLVFQM